MNFQMGARFFPVTIPNRIGVALLIVPEHLPSGALADSDGPKAGGQG